MSARMTGTALARMASVKRYECRPLPYICWLMMIDLKNEVRSQWAIVATHLHDEGELGVEHEVVVVAWLA